ncbi:TrmH family RNA methyltransferase [Glaciimonas immobilis]|uniref:TrmH family RNA methyltransferase n=1 Tax=Glaciimonas immobilis TaxID=728004 RepID=A0A840S186_9BURK|nr:RNA methyltransferase [Glaciimonas immobilis]KAF3996250.1 RNA methyltransferase [Glaciimonas immobilis]MBB5202339.1 TrmH family RNA methyltransferase [Glaciimonas immobilis]
MKLITSPANALYKELKLLATRSQTRRKSGKSLLDGVHLTEAYLQHHGFPTLCIVSESALSHAEVAVLVARCEAGGVECVAFSDAHFSTLSQVEHGIGLIFVINTPQFGPPGALIQSAVLLDNLQDPGNLGSILRSAAAAGIKQIYCSSGTVYAWSPKVLRAGMGAHFLLQIFENVDLLALVGNAQIPVLATSSYARQSIYQADLKVPLAWLFGHEGQGVAEDLLARATQQVVIPHAGAMESLNVAAAAAVCFFEQMRQTQS